MSNFADDLGFAWRSLRKNPGFAAVAIITLALGIGTNAAIFSIVNGVLLQPLDLPEPDRLVFVNGELRNRNVAYFPSSPTDWRELNEAADLLQGIAGYNTFNNTLKGNEGDAEQVATAGVTNNFFEVAGVRPFIGRVFSSTDSAFAPEDVPEGTQFPQNTFAPAKVALISYGLWQRRFGGNEAVLGQVVNLGGNQVEIIGVMPRSFRFEMPAEANVNPEVSVWLPNRVDFENAVRTNVFMNLFGRLNDGVSMEQAQGQLDAYMARQRELYEINKTAGWYATYRDFHTALTAPVRNSVLVLMVAVVFVLLIAAANVANLMLVRASARSRETAIRAALGGNRKRLLRQMLLEAGLIAAGGALLGLAIAQAGIGFLHALGPDGLPRANLIQLDLNVVVFTVLVAAVATIAAGIVPALRVSRPDLVNELRERSGSSQSSGGKLFRDAMVVLEVTLSFVLLVGAGLMVRSFVALQSTDPGFNPDGVLVFNLNLPNDKYPLPADGFRLTDLLAERISGLPGVEQVGSAGPLPLTGGAFNGRYASEENAADLSAYRQASYRAVNGNYFRAMQTPLLAGRVFNRDDEDGALPYVVIDDIMAQKAFANEDPLGSKLMVRFGPEPTLVEVIGVVRHQASQSLNEEGQETIFLVNKILPFGPFGSWTVRTSGDPNSLAGPVRSLVKELDPDVVIQEMRTMGDVVKQSQSRTWFALSLISIFGIIALILASVGLYSVLAYLVRLRRGELGVRMAFGATPMRIFRMVVGRGLTLAALGAFIGAATALSTTRLMEEMLVQISPTDPATFLTVGVLFMVIAFLATFLPARRATRLDPVRTLRWE